MNKTTTDIGLKFLTSKLLFSPKFEATSFEMTRKLSNKGKRHFNWTVPCQNQVLLEYLAYDCVYSINHLTRLSNHVNLQVTCQQRVFGTVANGNVQFTWTLRVVSHFALQLLFLFVFGNIMSLWLYRITNPSHFLSTSSSCSPKHVKVIFLCQAIAIAPKVACSASLATLSCSEYYQYLAEESALNQCSIWDTPSGIHKNWGEKKINTLWFDLAKHFVQ